MTCWVRLLQLLLILACVQQAWNKAGPPCASTAISPLPPATSRTVSTTNLNNITQRAQLQLGAKVRNVKRMGGKQAGRTGGGGGGSADGMDDGGDFGSIYGASHRNMSHEERLLAYLFREYDPVARAVMDTSKPVVVSVDFVLLRIHGLDERSQVLTTTGLVIAEWTDDRLTWDPEDFGNLTDIIIKANKIWLPELAVMNGADELIPDFERIRVLLSNNGMLHWEPGGIFRTTCDIDITYFPFDTQHCPLLIGAYSYYSSKMNITNTSSEISTHDFRLNGEWHVYGTSTEWGITVLDCCPGKGYPHVVFTLHLKRRYKFYMMNIVLPCVMLSVLIMIGFFLPPDAGEKISLGISVLLAFTVFLLMIADNIPRTSLAIPLMVIYLTATMTLGTISICLTVLVLNVHHRGARYPVPGWLRRLVLVYISRVICVKSAVTRAQTEPLEAEDAFYARRKMEKLKNRKKMAANCSPEGNGVVGDDMELLSLTVATSRHATAVPNGPRAVPVARSTSAALTANCENHNLCTCGAFNSGPPAHNNSSTRGGGRGGRSASAGGGDDACAEDPEAEPDYSQDWHELAHVLDRLFFWLLFIGMTASAVFILLYPRYMGIVT